MNKEEKSGARGSPSVLKLFRVWDFAINSTMGLDEIIDGTNREQ